MARADGVGDDLRQHFGNRYFKNTKKGQKNEVNPEITQLVSEYLITAFNSLQLRLSREYGLPKDESLRDITETSRQAYDDEIDKDLILIIANPNYVDPKVKDVFTRYSALRELEKTLILTS